MPILKQINRHNDDGSYSYGYENADGTFKIETKYPSGEVYGKYGYIGDDGKTREIEYGASKRGFEIQGTDITVPPPVLNNVNADTNSLDYDDGQYREDPAIYNSYKKSSKNRQPARFNYNNVAQVPAPAPAPAPVYNPPPPTQAPAYYSPPVPSYRYNSPPAFNYNVNAGQAATRVDFRTGSYSLSYSG